MLLSYLLAKAMNRMTWTVAVTLSGIHLDRRQIMFIVPILIPNVDELSELKLSDMIMVWFGC